MPLRLRLNIGWEGVQELLPLSCSVGVQDENPYGPVRTTFRYGLSQLTRTGLLPGTAHKPGASFPALFPAEIKGWDPVLSSPSHGGRLHRLSCALIQLPFIAPQQVGAIDGESLQPV